RNLFSCCQFACGGRSYGWLAAVPPCVGFAGWLFGGMDSKPLFSVRYYFSISMYLLFISIPFNQARLQISLLLPISNSQTNVSTTLGFNSISVVDRFPS